MIYLYSWPWTVLSKTLESAGRMLMGRELLGSVLDSFLYNGVMTAFFHLSGTILLDILAFIIWQINIAIVLIAILIYLIGTQSVLVTLESLICKINRMQTVVGCKTSEGSKGFLLKFKFIGLFPISLAKFSPTVENTN